MLFHKTETFITVFTCGLSLEKGFQLSSLSVKRRIVYKRTCGFAMMVLALKMKWQSGKCHKIWVKNTSCGVKFKTFP